MCSSIAVSRCSLSPALRDLGQRAREYPASADPCHSRSAASNDPAAPPRSPAAPARAPRPGPGEHLRVKLAGCQPEQVPRPARQQDLARAPGAPGRGSSAARSRATWTCSAFTELARQILAPDPVDELAAETTWFARTARSPSTARRCGAPSSSSRHPARRARAEQPDQQRWPVVDHHGTRQSSGFRPCLKLERPGYTGS